ncbi:N-acetylglucosamine kinase [Streptomyces sp. STR69]|uniref:N-acetylglucosamine kinase n=1 Tax=Streptomyces sp. STR69 TaxID=1796942 RepID=UPI0021CAB245|nr:BadF/BadG/BcrA/BcrD ATPase family protein [Streptomyces sp. STR69]
MSSGLLLAVDGGNSKTDLAVLTTDGTVLGRARGGGFRPQAVGLDAAMDVLAALRAEAMAAAGVGADTVVDGITAFLAGADLPHEVKALREAVGARRWAVTQRVDNDSYAVLRAGAARPWGVGVVCGTGINCVGVAPDGRTTGFAALGRISGDWGGGIDMGTSALWHAARAEDGRGAPTALRAAVTGHFGLAAVADVTAALHSGDLPALRLSELCPAVFAARDDGDEIATELVERLAAEIARMALTVLCRLQLATAPDPEVVLGGSVLAAGHRSFLDDIERRLTEAVPGVRPVVCTQPPLLGAALAALDLHPRAAPGAEARLRAGFRGSGAR